MGATFVQASMKITHGELKSFVREGHGRSLRCNFCPECGSRICHQWFDENGDPPHINLKPGTLDDTIWLKPDYHSWLSSAQGWEAFHPDDTLFEEQSGRL